MHKNRFVIGRVGFVYSPLTRQNPLKTVWRIHVGTHPRLTCHSSISSVASSGISMHPTASSGGIRSTSQRQMTHSFAVVNRELARSAVRFVLSSVLLKDLLIMGNLTKTAIKGSFLYKFRSSDDTKILDYLTIDYVWLLDYFELGHANISGVENHTLQGATSL